MFRNCGATQHWFNSLNRREMLQFGGLSIGGIGGLGLPDMLRLKAQSPTKSTVKSVIMVCLPGGPSHMEMYDMKPDAPSDYRGEFKPIATNLPGFDICEHMPLQATMMDKLAVVRSLQFVE